MTNPYSIEVAKQRFDAFIGRFQSQITLTEELVSRSHEYLAESRAALDRVKREAVWLGVSISSQSSPSCSDPSSFTDTSGVGFFSPDASDTTRPILLVDDFDDGRELYAEYLSFKGFQVRTAASGAEAIRLIQAECPSLVLMDIGMQDMTGTEAMKWLRENHVCDGVPIVALTAFALEAETTQALADGFDAVIPKPCLPDDLVTFITSILSK